MSSLLRNSTLETVFRPFPISASGFASGSFVWYLFQDVPFFCFFYCLLSGFALNHNAKHSFVSHLLSCCCLFLVCFGILLFFDLLLPIKNISRKIGSSENPQMKNAEKKDGHFDRSS